MIMQYYNLYYKSSKINRLPIAEKDARTILNNRSIRRKIGNEYEEIPTNKIKIIKCIVV